jgi:hypothetical protein
MQNGAKADPAVPGKHLENYAKNAKQERFCYTKMGKLFYAPLTSYAEYIYLITANFLLSVV